MDVMVGRRQDVDAPDLHRVDWPVAGPWVAHAALHPVTVDEHSFPS
jgi:hypothetical protein